MKNKLKVSIIGGGSSYTPDFVSNILSYHEKFPISELCLIDIESNQDRLDIISNFASEMIKKSNLNIKLTKTLDRKLGLKDSDFVIIQIRVGRISARINDEIIPSKYNLLGHETFGLGGLFNTLRTIPVIYEIIDDIKHICPHAWVINVTNPTGIISEAIYRYSDLEKFVGVCSDPIQMINDLSKALDTTSQEIVPYFVGLNHLSFVTKLYHNHKDKLQEVIKDEKSLERFKNDKTYLKSLESYPHPDYDFYLNYDEILEKQKDNFRNGNIRALKVQQIEEELFSYYKDIKNPFNKDLSRLRNGSDYSLACLDVMSGIHNNTKDYVVINTRNNGHITDLPNDAAIEITARITKNGPIPVHIGVLPLQIRGIIQHVKAYEQLLVDAIYEKDINKCLMAYQNHPLTTSLLKNKKAFDELFNLNKQYLTYYGAYNYETK